MKKSSGKEGEKNVDEVQQLLQAAQDQLLLKLSVDSHLARPSASAAASSFSSNNYLDLDLDRRFQALKSSGPSVSIASPIDNRELKAVLGDDLSARFAALKAKSNPSSSSTAIAAKEVPFDHTLYKGEDEDEEDQVEKLIQWAKDAARLDPSPPSDDEPNDDAEDDDSVSESEDTDNSRKRK